MIGYITLFASALIGIGIASGYVGKSVKRLDLILFIGSGYLFTLTITHLIPELLNEAGILLETGSHHGHVHTHSHGHEEDHDIPLWALFLTVGAGFALHRLLEVFTRGVDHGHVHQAINASPVVLLVSISIHAFVEGAILMLSSDANMLVGILLHKVPAGFILGSLIFLRYGKTVKSWVLLLLFCVASPLGLFLAQQGLHTGVLDEVFQIYLMALVTGTFLQLSVVLIWEKLKKSHFETRFIVCFMIGAILSLALLMVD